MNIVCVYQIRNAINGKCYIGSTRNYVNRKRVHLYDLRKNKHHSPHLQKSWNKYGQNCFAFIILEECDASLLVKQEQAWLDKLLPEYNILPRAYSMAGRIVSEETKRRMSEAKKGIPVSEETRRKIAATLTGRKIPREIVLRAALAHVGLKYGPASLERRIKISKALKGRINGPRSDETKKKIAATHLGMKHSEQTKQKISLNRSGIGCGKRSSQMCELIGRAKAVMNEDEVRNIKQLCAAGLSHRRAGVMFGTNKTTIGQIVRGQSYKWVAG